MNKQQGQTPLQSLFATYLQEVTYTARLRPATIRGYQAVFHLFIKMMPEVTDTQSLSSDSLTEFFKRIETRPRLVGTVIKTGVKESTIRTQWAKLNTFFNWLCRKGHIKENPLKGIRPPHVSYDDFRRLEDSQIQKLYAAIAIHSTSPLMMRRDLVMVSLLLFCGVRKTEFISLQVRDIDLLKGQVTIRAETSKSKRTRMLPLNPTLIMHLKDYFKERKQRGITSEHLIISSQKDERLTEHGLKHWVLSMIRKSGVKFHLHAFRHTFACKLAEQNVNFFKIQKLMGHTDIKMTMKYLRSLQTEDMAEDIGKLTI